MLFKAPFSKLGVSAFGFCLFEKISKKYENIYKDNIENIKKVYERFKMNMEKREIIQNIDPGGTLILNRDDKFFNHLKKLANKKKIKVISFGKSKYSTIRLIKLKKFENFNEVTVNVKNEIVKLKIKCSFCVSLRMGGIFGFQTQASKWLPNCSQMLPKWHPNLSQVASKNAVWGLVLGSSLKT